MTNLPENPVDLDPMSYQFNKKGKHYGESLKILGKKPDFKPIS